MTQQLKGWVSFWRDPYGQFFFSDSYPTEKECRAKYGNADIDGYVDLSLIPPEAIKGI